MKNAYRLYFLLFTLFLLAAICVLLLTFQQETKKPSIVMIVIDTLRSDHLGCFGYPRETSPHIDGLASEGVLFKNTVAQSSWTLPSMVSMMTGMHTFYTVNPMPEHTPSLAELLKRQGYMTLGVVANSLVGVEEGFSRGFDEYVVPVKQTREDLPGRLDPDSQTRQDSDHVQRMLQILEENQIVLTPDKTADTVLTELAVSWLEKQVEAPFFLYLHYLGPHDPYTPPEGYGEFNDDHDPITTEMINRFNAFAEERPELKGEMARNMEAMRRQITLYDGEIKYVDKCVGDVLAALERLNLADDTVVVLTSDHGECLWNHLQFPEKVEMDVPPEERDLTTYFFQTHGQHLFDELIQVPLMFKGPGMLKNKIIENPVENVDIMPTLLTLAGASTSPGEGQSLLPSLRFANRFPAKKDVLFSFSGPLTCAIMPAHNLKLVRPNNREGEFEMETTLFDLSQDPEEDRDFSTEGEKYRKAVRELTDLIEHREQATPLKQEDPAYSEATLQKMRELGYIK